MFEQGFDQAAGLRRQMAPPPLGLLAFPMAQGAPGQWVASLVHGMRALGRKPLVLDAGRGALVSAFGMRLRHELIDLLRGERDFDAVAKPTRDGVYVLRGERGVDAFVSSGAPASRLLDGFARLSHGFDELLLAMPASELACLVAPGENVPVVGLEPGAEGQLRSYALVKELAEDFGYRRFACVVHGADDELHARGEYARLAHAADRFLGAEMRLAAWLPAPGDWDAGALMRAAQALLNTATAPPAPACGALEGGA